MTARSGRRIDRELAPAAKRHLPPDEWYPVASPGAAARLVEIGDGERARFVEAGPRAAPAAILLHGWGASAYSFRHVLPLLARHGLRGIALDLRGHGLSAKPADPARYSSEAMARQVVELMDALALPGAVLVGQSMGGGIALDVAARAPERTKAVVLAAPVGLTAIRRITVARALRAHQWFPDRVPRWGVALLMRRIYGTVRAFEDRDVDEYWAPAQFPDFSRALFMLVNAFNWNRRPVETLIALGERVRIMLGERDRLVTWSRARLRVRAVPSANVRVVAGAGHLLAEEVPELVASAVREVMG